MKRIHLVSLLLAVIMLFTAAAPAMAATLLGDTARPPQHEHSFGPLTIIEEATCQTRAKAQRVCSGCGHTEWTYVGELGDHRWGEWEEVTEQEGIKTIIKMIRTCEVCGATEEDASAWAVLPAAPVPEGLNPGLTVYVEVIDHYTSIQSGKETEYVQLRGYLVNSGDTKIFKPSMTSNNHAVAVYINKDPFEPGERFPRADGSPNGCTWTEEVQDTGDGFDYIVVAASAYSLNDNGDKIPVSGKKVVKVPIQAGQPAEETAPLYWLSLEHGRTEETLYPSLFPGWGDIYWLVLHNDSDKLMHIEGINVTGDDDGQDDPQAASLTATEGGDTSTCYYKLYIGPGDIAKGKVHREISFNYSYHDESSDKPVSGTTNTVSLDVELITPPDPHSELTLTLDSASAAGMKLGDQVSGTFTVSNTGNVLLVLGNLELKDYPGRGTDPNAADDLSDWNKYYNLLFGQEEVCTFKYSTTIVADDLAAGCVVRDLCVNAGVFDEEVTHEGVASNWATMSVPLTPTATEDGEPLTAVKERVGEPANGIGYVVGEKIHYKVTVTNDSDETVHGLALFDPIFKQGGEGAIDTRQSLVPGGEPWVVEFDYTVTEEDFEIFTDGVLYNQANVTYSAEGDGEDGTAYTNTVSAPLYTTPVPTEPSALTLTAVLKEPGPFAAGQMATVLLTVTNNTDVPLSYYGSNTAPDPGWPETLYPYEPVTVQSYFTPTEEIISEFAANDYKRPLEFLVHYQGSASKNVYHAKANIDIPLKPGEKDDAFLKVTLERQGEPDNGIGYVINEKIHFVATVTNISKETLTEINLGDLLLSKITSGWQAHRDSLAPGEPWVVPLDYAVRAMDIEYYKYTKLTNRVDVCYARPSDPNDDPDHNWAQSNEVEAPLYTEPVPTEKKVSIIKECVNEPKNHTYYTPGEKIKYAITVINGTDDVLNTLYVWDPLITDEYIMAYTDVAPGFKDTIEVQYEVKEDDPPKEVVINYAYCNGISGRTQFMAASLEVISPVGEPDANDPLSGDGCVRVLTRKGDSLAEYGLHFCEEHEALDAEIQALLEAAATDAEKISAYETGVNRWNQAIEKLCRELAEKTGKTEDSRAAFGDYLAAYEDVLKNSLGLSDAETAARIMDQLRLRCIDLCYVLHSEPEAHRPDSAVYGSYTADTGRTMDETSSLALTGRVLRVSLSAKDSQIEADLTAALRTAETDEAKAAAFSAAELDYRMALMERAAALAAEADRTARRGVMAWQTSTFSLLDADTDLYEALYPDHPEAAAEIVCREARELLTVSGK